MTFRSFLSSRRLRWALGGVVLLVLLAVVLIAAFPFGAFRPQIERRLSARFGRPVTVGAVRRLDRFSFAPTVAIEGIRIPQAAWAGRGDLARIASARVTFRTLPLLFGSFSPSSIDVAGVRLSLVRAADGRVSWQAPDEPARSAGGGNPVLDRLHVSDAQVAYRDLKRQRSFTVNVVADPVRGVAVRGTGSVRGGAVTVAAQGAPVGGTGRWPFRADIAGATLTVHATGVADRPLNLDAMDLDVTAKASDLRNIDAIVEAGLFGTRAVSLKAHVRHDQPDWTITALTATIGRSDLAGDATVKKRDGRTLIDTRIRSRQLDFDDLSSDEGRARNAARIAAQGRRMIPYTAIDLTNLQRTDITATIAVQQLLTGTPAPLQRVRGTVKIDHGRLDAAPIRIALKQGMMTGSLRIDQRGGRRTPLVTIDATIADSSLGTFAGDGPVDGRLRGRVHLVGTGDTLHAAVARSDGRVGLVADRGTLPARLASFLGLDVGRGITSGSGDEAGLRCLVLDLDVRRGIGRPDPLVIDTTRAQTHGRGAISLDSDRLALTITGAPKHNSLLRLAGPVTVTGTVQSPQVTVPPGTRSVGGVLKMLGRAITGKQGALASDADCAGLSARALGR